MLSVAAAAPAASAPAAPSALTATFGSNGLVLAWTDASSDETGFSIERCLGASCTAFGQIATVGAGSTTYTDTYRAEGVDRYRVRAFNGAGYSGYSNVAEIPIFGTGEVFPSITATPTSGSASLTVTFDGSLSTTLNGTIASHQWSFGDDQTASGAVVTHTYATPGVYAASLKATSSTFGSSNSTAVIIVVAPPPLVAPGDLSATSPARGQIRLTWTNPVSSATSLAVERCKGSGCTSFARIAVLAGSATSFLDSTVKRGTTYRYRLGASDATATVYSNIATAVSR
jgi:PKD repeat protein